MVIPTVYSSKPISGDFPALRPGSKYPKHLLVNYIFDTIE